MPNATHHDAEIVLKIYDLRREPVMRKAREWMVSEFWPRSADDVMAIMNGSFQETASFRQCVSFCEMCASLPLHGAVNSELFADWNGEMIFVYAKFKPFLAEIREKSKNPAFLANTERYLEGSDYTRKKVAATEARVKMFAERHAAGGK